MRISRASALLVLLCTVTGLAAGCGDDEDGDGPRATGPTPTQRPQPPPEPRRTDDPVRTTTGEPRVETVAEGLEVPWEIAFLPDGRALITERGGTVRLLSADGQLATEAVGRIDVQAVGEGGLLGLAVDPRFADTGRVYAYRTTPDGNEVVRLVFANGRLGEPRTVLGDIAASAIHDGGRLRFGPDGRLYVTTGDAGREELSQGDGVNGKILRLRGTRAETVSTGHRNPQGLAWQPGSDRLVATEHGPEGQDEVNVIRPGANYGWPEVRGAEHGRFQAPVAVYEQSIAPSGGTFVSRGGSSWTGDLVFGALVGEQMRRVSFDGAAVDGQEVLFAGRFGRIRTVVEGPDGALYALTNNTDGRGAPREGDDRLLRIVPPGD